jgi:hypothetical protein
MSWRDGIGAGGYTAGRFPPLGDEDPRLFRLDSRLR